MMSLNRAAVILPSILPSSSSPRNNHSTTSVNRMVVISTRAAVAAESCRTDQSSRRSSSANYEPSTWSYEFLQSFKVNDINEENQLYTTMAVMLEREVSVILKCDNVILEENSLHVLELIDSIQRLGLARRFENEIREALEKYFIISSSQGGSSMGMGMGMGMADNKSLHAVALHFRVLRQNGYIVSQDVFKDFLSDKDGAFLKECGHYDVKDMLSLYEASYLAYQGEDILDKARVHATQHLNKFLLESNFDDDDNNMEECLVRHSLEVPLHRRMVMLEARWYIEAYKKKKEGANLALLELAKLEFNMAQSVLQEDLKFTSRWWNDLGLAKELSFSRDRLVECCFWTVGMMFEPRFSSCRKALTQVTSFITIIDDIYDVYGTMDELEQFTDVVERWDINVVSSLPNYMKLCFLAFYNTINEMGYEALKKHGHNTIPYLSKVWADMLKAFLKEAKWSSKECERPTFSEYLENAWRSVSGTVILTHTYCLLDDEHVNYDHITFSKEALSHLVHSNEILRWPSVIFRLCNDLATSSEEIARGETVNAISCYMNENRASEEHARKHIQFLIDEATLTTIKWDDTISVLTFLLLSFYIYLLINSATKSPNILS